MSLRRVDARFLLPRLPERAFVVGGQAGWSEGLEAAGIEVVSRPRDGVELAVAPVGRLDEALRAGPELLVVEGHGAARPLRRAGYAAARYLARPAFEAPDLLLPLDDAEPSRYAVTHWASASTRWRRARNRLAAAVATRGALPELGPVTTVAARQAAPPALVSAAQTQGAGSDVRWFLACGQGDELSRNVFHLFPPGSETPTLVVKFARVPGYSGPFERDEAGLRLAAQAGGAVAAHAPRLEGRFQLRGLEASVETAASGRRLRAVLESTRSRDRRAALIDEVAGWIVAVGETTAGRDGSPAAELGRLAVEVVPRWAELGDGEALLRDLVGVPAVLQHNDLGPWNVVVREGGFTAVDWESARPNGLPLWDLLYFLTEGLASLERVTDAERDDFTVRLYRGELPSSRTLFSWLRRAVRSIDVPAGAVGRIATLCWLHHGLSHTARASELGRFAPRGAASIPPIERVAGLWLADPALGPGWNRWRDGD